MASKTLLSLEQFEQLPDDGMRHELDEGELISMPPPLGRHGRIALEIGVLLRSFVDPRSLGDVFVESGFRLNRDTVRSPDVSFIRAERSRTMDPDQRFEGGPDLAVEMISPSETAADIAHKVGQYLAPELWCGLCIREIGLFTYSNLPVRRGFWEPTICWKRLLCYPAFRSESARSSLK